MANLHVKVDLEQFSRTRVGSIVGPLWVELGESAFPEKGWYDFPVVLLTWWGRALRAHAGTHSDVVLDFMDGPYEIRLKAAAEGCAAVFYDRHGSGHVEYEATVDCARLRKTILGQSKQVLAHCRANDWANDDTATLANEVTNAGDVAR